MTVDADELGRMIELNPMRMPRGAQNSRSEEALKHLRIEMFLQWEHVLDGLLGELRSCREERKARLRALALETRDWQPRTGWVPGCEL